MSKVQRARKLGLGYRTTTAGEGYALRTEITDGLKSCVGRKVDVEMSPEEAASMAWGMLAAVARHHEKAARCTHPLFQSRVREDGQGMETCCATCGAPRIEGLRTVYSPAVPIYRGDDVRLSLSYLERMNDVKLREAVDDFLVTLKPTSRQGGRERKQLRHIALRRLVAALRAARKPAHFHADVPMRQDAYINGTPDPKVDGLVWTDKPVERAVHVPSNTRYALTSETIRGEGTWWDVFVYDDDAERPTRRLAVDSGNPTKARARGLIRRDARGKNG